MKINSNVFKIIVSKFLTVISVFLLYPSYSNSNVVNQVKGNTAQRFELFCSETWLDFIVKEGGSFPEIKQGSNDLGPLIIPVKVITPLEVKNGSDPQSLGLMTGKLEEDFFGYKITAKVAGSKMALTIVQPNGVTVLNGFSPNGSILMFLLNDGVNNHKVTCRISKKN